MIAMQTIATEAVLAPPDPDGPGMFRCAAPGYVSALYQAAGLRDVAEWNVDVELVTRSPAQYWEMISEHVSLAVAALAQAGEPSRERIAKAVIAKVSTYEEDWQGKDSGRGPLHRRHEVGTPGLPIRARLRLPLNGHYGAATTEVAAAGLPTSRPAAVLDRLSHNACSRAATAGPR